MHYQAFKTSFPQKKLAPAYLLAGEEIYLKQKTIELIIQKWKKTSSGRSLAIFDLKETELNEVLDTAETYPFFSPPRLVIAKNFQEDKNKKGQERLLNYLRNPAPFTCLVLVGEKINKNGLIYQHVAEVGECVEFYHPFPQQLPFWVSQLAKERGKSISPGASRLLIEKIGGNLQELNSEIEKISLYLGERKKIERQDIEEVSGEVKVNTVFELCTYLTEKKITAVLLTLKKLAQTGEEPLRILFLLTNQLRKIWLVQNCLQKGISEKEIKSMFNLRPMWMKEIIKSAQKFQGANWEFIFQTLLEADRNLKRGLVPGYLTLELLAIKICHQ